MAAYFFKRPQCSSSTIIRCSERGIQPFGELRCSDKSGSRSFAGVCKNDITQHSVTKGTHTVDMPFSPFTLPPKSFLFGHHIKLCTSTLLRFSSSIANRGYPRAPANYPAASVATRFIITVSAPATSCTSCCAFGWRPLATCSGAGDRVHVGNQFHQSPHSEEIRRWQRRGIKMLPLDSISAEHPLYAPVRIICWRTVVNSSALIIPFDAHLQEPSSGWFARTHIW